MTPFGLSHLEPLGSASAYIADIYPVVRVLAEFENFTASEYTLLCKHMVCFGAPGKTTLIREGDPGDFLVIVLTGEVQVFKTDENQRQQGVARVGPGSILGEMSLIDGQVRFASCISTVPTDLAVLTRESLNRILNEHPSLGVKLSLVLLQLMTARLRDATSRMLCSANGEWV